MVYINLENYVPTAFDSGGVASRVLTELLIHNSNNLEEKVNGIIVATPTQKAYKI